MNVAALLQDSYPDGRDRQLERDSYPPGPPDPSPPPPSHDHSHRHSHSPTSRTFPAPPAPPTSMSGREWEESSRIRYEPIGSVGLSIRGCAKRAGFERNMPVPFMLPQHPKSLHTNRAKFTSLNPIISPSSSSSFSGSPQLPHKRDWGPIRSRHGEPSQSVWSPSANERCKGGNETDKQERERGIGIPSLQTRHPLPPRPSSFNRDRDRDNANAKERINRNRERKREHREREKDMDILRAIASERHAKTQEWMRLPGPANALLPPPTGPSRTVAAVGEKCPGVGKPDDLGKFVYPHTPFPYTFPLAADVEKASGKKKKKKKKKNGNGNNPQQQQEASETRRVTILIPSEHLPVEPSLHPEIWGGCARASPTHNQNENQTFPKRIRRVYTDDSDLVLCAVHSGFVRWSAMHRARTEGKDMALELRVVKVTGDVQKFVGGWGERCWYDADGLGDNDDGRGILSNEYRDEHGGSGIAVISAQFVEKKATLSAPSIGLRNRAERLAEYRERRAAAFELGSVSADISIGVPFGPDVRHKRKRIAPSSPADKDKAQAGHELDITDTHAQAVTENDHSGFKYSHPNLPNGVQGPPKKRRKVYNDPDRQGMSVDSVLDIRSGEPDGLRDEGQAPGIALETSDEQLISPSAANGGIVHVCAADPNPGAEKTVGIPIRYKRIITQKSSHQKPICGEGKPPSTEPADPSAGSKPSLPNRSPTESDRTLSSSSAGEHLKPVPRPDLESLPADVLSTDRRQVHSCTSPSQTCLHVTADASVGAIAPNDPATNLFCSNDLHTTSSSHSPLAMDVDNPQTPTVNAASKGKPSAKRQQRRAERRKERSVLTSRPYKPGFDFPCPFCCRKLTKGGLFDHLKTTHRDFIFHDELVKALPVLRETRQTPDTELINRLQPFLRIIA